MTEQERIHKPTEEVSDQVDLENSTAVSSSSDLITELDNLLDEIDAVLVDNAEDFVRNYVQKGGE
jgi:ubiquitin-like protein Pup